MGDEAKTAATARRGAILARQRQDWPRRIKLGQDGNPFATLCQHCYGRHAPPRDEICPREATSNA